MRRLCTACVQVAEGSQCPRCGADTSPFEQESLDAAVRTSLAQTLTRWVARGRLDPGQATQLRREVEVAGPARLAPAAAVCPPAPAAALAPSAPSPAPLLATPAPQVEAPEPPAHDVTAPAAVADAGLDHLEALHALDAGEPGPASRLTALLARNLWWLLGGALVLGGSVLGVREAWRALEGPYKPLLVAGAVCAYHLFFLGLGHLAGRRSAESGRVLTAVALALLPVALGAAIALTDAAPLMGALAGLGVLGLGAATLGRAAHRFEDLPATPLRLAVLLPLGVTLLAGLLNSTGPPASLLTALLAPLGLWAVGARASPFVSGPGVRLVAALALLTVPFLGTSLPAFGASALFAVTAGGALNAATHGLHPRWRPGVVGLGGLAAVLLGGAWGALVALTMPEAPALPLLAPLLATLVFVDAARERPGSWHLALALGTTTLIALQRRFWPAPDALAALAPGIVAAALLHLRPPISGRPLWLLGLGLAATVCLAWPGGDAPALPLAPLVVGLAVAALVHAAARGRDAGDHLGLLVVWAGLVGTLGGLSARPEAALDAFVWLPLPYLPFALGLSALGWRSRGPQTVALSLAALTGLVSALGGVDQDAPAWLLLAGAAPFVALVSRRAAVHVTAGLVVLICVHVLFGGRAEQGPVVAATLLGLGLLASLAAWRFDPAAGSPDAPPPEGPRALLEPREGDEARPLQGLATAAAVGLLLVAAPTAAFLDAPVEVRRGLALLTAAPFLLLPLLAFLGHGYTQWSARGHPATLALGFGGAVLLAVVNRAGRPLPPAEQALRYTAVGFALWAAARLMSPRMEGWARALGRPESGSGYRWVVDGAVAALAVLLLARGVFLEAAWQTPALFPGGAGLLLVLLALSAAQPWLVVLGAPLAALGLALALLAGGLGPLEPDALLVPGAFASRWTRATLGTALVCALASAALTLVHRRLPGDHARASTLRALAATFGGLAPLAWLAGARFALDALDPRLPAAALVLAGSFALSRAAARSAWFLGLGLATALLWACTRGGALHPWSGPAFATLGGALLIAAAFVGRRPGGLADRLAPGHLAGVARVVLVAAVVAALARAATLSSGRVLEDMAEAAARGLDGLPLGAPVLAATLALIALALLTHAALRPAALGLFLGGVLPLPALVLAANLNDAPAIAPALVVLAVMWHVAIRRAPDRTRALRGAREVLLAAVGLLAVWVVVVPATRASDSVLAALALTFVFGAGRAIGERSGLAAFHAQLAAVLAYAVFRAVHAPALNPAWDALAAFALAFVLIGVAVGARRAGALPVAAAVRRFAALLPVVAQLVAIVDGASLGQSQDAVAAGGALVYLTLAVVEHSRAFGALATLAGQIAFVLWSAGQDPRLLPTAAVLPGALGATMLVLSQLYAAHLNHATRQTVRLVGGLLLFIPGAVDIITRLGEGDARFALAFGALCLLAVAAGTWFHVRAYLFLGGLFFLLDVGAHVAFAGLRDQRLGFAVMTLLGLGILGAMAGFSLRREAAARLGRAARRILREWD